MICLWLRRHGHSVTLDVVGIFRKGHFPLCHQVSAKLVHLLGFVKVIVDLFIQNILDELTNPVVLCRSSQFYTERHNVQSLRDGMISEVSASVHCTYHLW